MNSAFADASLDALEDALYQKATFSAASDSASRRKVETTLARLIPGGTNGCDLPVAMFTKGLQVNQLPLRCCLSTPPFSPLGHIKTPFNVTSVGATPFSIFEGAPTPVACRAVDDDNSPLFFFLA